MRLEDFRNVHKGEDIYILAPGASINEYNEDFWNVVFQHKVIAISVCLLVKSQIGIPNYWIGMDDSGQNREMLIDYFEWLLFFKKKVTFFACYDDPFSIDSWVRINNFSGGSGLDKFFDKDIESVDGLVTDTSLQGAISLALYMGSRNITLIGADFGLYKGQYHWNDKKPHVPNYRRDKIYTDQIKQYKLFIDKASNKDIIINRIMPKEEVCSIK